MGDCEMRGGRGRAEEARLRKLTAASTLSQVVQDGNITLKFDKMDYLAVVLGDNGA